MPVSLIKQDRGKLKASMQVFYKRFQNIERILFLMIQLMYMTYIEIQNQLHEVVELLIKQGAKDPVELAMDNFSLICETAMDKTMTPQEVANLLIQKGEQHFLD